jgi:hypothetical protein
LNISCFQLKPKAFRLEYQTFEPEPETLIAEYRPSIR